MNGMAKRGKTISQVAILCAMAVLLAPKGTVAKDKKTRIPAQQQRLTDYRLTARETAALPPSSVGSLWVDGGSLADMAADYKARHVNDLITIRIVERTTAQAQSTVKTQRTLAATSSLATLFGQVGAPSSLQNLFSPNSSQALNGQGQTASTTTLQTSLGGHVVEVLPNGVLVVEAGREVAMNNERQAIVVRGLVRPGDLAPDNSVLSTAISNLEVELRGKGVISDGVRPPNRIVRSLLWLFGF